MFVVIDVELHLQKFTGHTEYLFSWKQHGWDFHFRIVLCCNINQIFLSELSRVICRHYSAYDFLKNSSLIYR